MEIAKYRIRGLDCASCASDIEKVLKADESLGAVAVSFATGTIAVNPEKLEKVRSIIGSVNPDVSILDNASADEEDRAVASKSRRHIIVLSIAAVFLVIGTAFNKALHNTPFSIAEYTVLIPPFILVGWPVILSAVRNILKGRFFEENFLMTIATIGAIAVHELPEAVAVMLFYSLGDFFQNLAVNRSRNAIKALMDIRPEYANLRENGKTIAVPPESVPVDSLILVKPGERVPLDGEIVDGSSFLDTSALTGESMPREVGSGEQILAGMINNGGVLTARVTKPYSESSLSKIFDMVENAAHRKAPTERFITKFARYYTPAVVLGALILAIVPPLILPDATFSEWVYRALILLVISCPCALLVSIPLGFLVGSEALHAGAFL